MAGHEPAISGNVGPGMVDVAVVGDIFAVPGPDACVEAIKLADKGHGVLFIVLNHAGDMLTGNLTMKACKKAGINVAKVVTQEDVSNAPREDAGNRRGLVGCIPTYKIAAGAANENKTLEEVAVDIEDAIRMNASCMAIQTFIGAEDQRETIKNINDTVNAGNRYGIPVLGVVAVGKNMKRTEKFYKLATRMLAEFGCSIIKTYYCENFKEVVAACPVPIVVAGGKKLPENECLELVYNAIKDGACGVDMGRNIFQAESPKAMAKAIGKVVHEGYTPDQAYDLYLKLKEEFKK